jgi:hypothetical protein
MSAKKVGSNQTVADRNPRVTPSNKGNGKSNGSGQECPLHTSGLYATAAAAPNCGV